MHSTYNFGYFSDIAKYKYYVYNITIPNRKAPNTKQLKPLKEVINMTNTILTEAWEYLLNIGVSEETLQIVTSINGYSINTLNDILYVVTGERDIADFI